MHRLLTFRAEYGDELWRHGGGRACRQGVKQSTDALELLFRGRALPPKGAYAAKAFRQDVLQEPSDEDERGQNRGALLACFGVFVAKGHFAVMFIELALGANGRAVNVSGEVGERLFAATDGLAIHDPLLAPHGWLDRMKERGILLAERTFKASAHAHANPSFL